MSSLVSVASTECPAAALAFLADSAMASISASSGFISPLYRLKSTSSVLHLPLSAMLVAGLFVSGLPSAPPVSSTSGPSSRFSSAAALIAALLALLAGESAEASTAARFTLEVAVWRGERKVAILACRLDMLVCLLFCTLRCVGGACWGVYVVVAGSLEIGVCVEV